MGYNIEKYTALTFGKASPDGKFRWSAVVIQNSNGELEPFCIVQMSIVSQEANVDIYFNDRSTECFSIRQCEALAMAMRDKNEKASDALMEAVRMVI